MSSYDAGRCRREITAAYESTRYKPSDSDMLLADAIDRLAADVAAVKAAVCDGSVAAERDRFLAGMGSAIKQRDKARRQRDEARAEVERLKAELAARSAGGNSPKTSDSSPAAPQPAAPAAGWLTERERHVLSSLLSERPCDSSLHWAEDVQPVFRSILSRAGSPPVVEVPAMGLAAYGFDSPFSSGEYRAGYREACLAHRDALDKAGVAWKEAGRE